MGDSGDFGGAVLLLCRRVGGVGGPNSRLHEFQNTVATLPAACSRARRRMDRPIEDRVSWSIPIVDRSVPSAVILAQCDGSDTEMAFWASMGKGDVQ